MNVKHSEKKSIIQDLLQEYNKQAETRNVSQQLSKHSKASMQQSENINMRKFYRYIYCIEYCIIIIIFLRASLFLAPLKVLIRSIESGPILMIKCYKKSGKFIYIVYNF